MTIQASTSLLRWKWILAAVALPVLVALWWAFRPERLWVNAKVNEPAPFATSGEPQPILTGRFEDKAQQTNGRATIFKKPGGDEYLHLSDFTTPNGPDVHVVLARSDNWNPAQGVVKGAIESLDLGPLKSNQGDQNYDVPAAADLNKYDAVVVFAQGTHTVSAWAKLAPF